MATKQPAKPAHDRTPENTPLPGGGSWQWDETAGQWLPLEPIAPDFVDKITQAEE